MPRKPEQFEEIREKSREKIQNAARELFEKRGFDGTSVDDIAKKARISKGLVYSYYESKEKLFEVVMYENFQRFVQDLMPVMGDEKASIDEIMERVVERYIEMLKKQPDLPTFIFNSIKSNNMPMSNKIGGKMREVRANFFNRVITSMKEEGIEPMHAAHFMMNFMGLILFPFIARPMVMRSAELNAKEFDELMEERKKLIPKWIKAIRKTK